jgi:DNA (cytosine-5)-methyltransferase 1
MTNSLNPNNPKSFQLATKRMLINPKSCYSGFVPPYPLCDEKEAIAVLMSAIDNKDQTELDDSMTDHFEQIELSEFSIYLPPSAFYHRFELRGLQNLTLPGHPYLLCDGIIQMGEIRRYVKQIPFEICSIGNYGVMHDEVGDNIWIQSNLNQGSEIYYKLTNPSSEYKRFHKDFIWLANFSKHFVDYCQSCTSPVAIQNFRHDFSRWLRRSHKSSLAFDSWYSAHDNEDFRSAFCRNVHFLFKESMGIDEKLRSHPIWSETLEMNFVHQQPIVETQTIVTP